MKTILRKYRLYTLALVILSFTNGACTYAQCELSSPSYQVLLSTLLDAEVPALCVDDEAIDQIDCLLDAREKAEYDVSHLSAARWIGYSDFSLDRLSGIDKNANILVYCSVGYRSEKITQQLIDNGYKNAKNLYGGIFEWINTDHVVQNEQGETLRVHPYDQLWGAWLDKGDRTYH